MSEKTKNIAALILAAGESKRMGLPKQNLIFRNNTLLNITKEQLNVDIVDRTFIVLGAYADEVIQASNLSSSEVIKYEGWKEGMGSSLSYACSIILKEKKYDGILITLSDLPLVEKLDYCGMLELFSNENDIVATKVKNTLGVPAILGRKYFNEILQLKGEKGAKSIIINNKDKVIIFENEKAAFDVDTLDDFKKLDL